MYSPVCPNYGAIEVSYQPNKRTDYYTGAPEISCGCIKCGCHWTFADTNREFVPAVVDPQLKPCPFCCEQAVFYNRSHFYCEDTWIVRCSKCFAESDDGLTKIEVAKKWNRRIYNEYS